MKKHMGAISLLLVALTLVSCREKSEVVLSSSKVYADKKSDEKYLNTKSAIENTENKKEYSSSIEISGDEKGVSKDINKEISDFSFEMLKHVSNKDNENSMVSAVSLYMNLGMLLNYTEGETYKELNEKLFKGINKEELNKYIKNYIEYVNSQEIDEETGINITNYKDMLEKQGIVKNEEEIIKSLNEMSPKELDDTKFTIKSIYGQLEAGIYNSIWKSDELKNGDTKTDQLLKDSYKSDINVVDFKDATVVQKINDWVNEKTKGTIPKIVEETSDDTKLILLNAVYFKGDWVNEFDINKTSKLNFTNIKSEKKEVDTMYLDGKLSIFKDKNLQAVKLPYKGNKYSILVMNSSVKEINKFIDEMDSEKLKEVLGKLEKKEAELYIPKFKSEKTLDMVGFIKEIGINKIFSDTYYKDLIKFGESNKAYSMTKILQKTYIDLNEKGTEASAVTGMFAEITSIEEKEKPTEIRFNEPFIYLIIDEEYKVPLFVGVLKDLN